MITYEACDRLTLNEIKEHPWFKGELPSSMVVKTELNERKNKVKLLNGA